MPAEDALSGANAGQAGRTVARRGARGSHLHRGGSAARAEHLQQRGFARDWLARLPRDLRWRHGCCAGKINKLL